MRAQNWSQIHHISTLKFRCYLQQTVHIYIYMCLLFFVVVWCGGIFLYAMRSKQWKGEKTFHRLLRIACKHNVPHLSFVFAPLAVSSIKSWGSVAPPPQELELKPVEPVRKLFRLAYRLDGLQFELLRGEPSWESVPSLFAAIWNANWNMK